MDVYRNPLILLQPIAHLKLMSYLRFIFFYFLYSLTYIPVHVFDVTFLLAWNNCVFANFITTKKPDDVRCTSTKLRPVKMYVAYIGVVVTTRRKCRTS